MPLLHSFTVFKDSSMYAKTFSRLVHKKWAAASKFARLQPTASEAKVSGLILTKKYALFQKSKFTTRKHCERSELRFHFEWTKKLIENQLLGPKIGGLEQFEEAKKDESNLSKDEKEEKNFPI